MFEIWNFGRSRKIPSSAGFITLTRGRGFRTDDKDLADHLAMFPSVSVTEIESEDPPAIAILSAEDPLPETGVGSSVRLTEEKLDFEGDEVWSDMKMSELHKVAKRRGIKDAFGQKKKWLINAILGKESER